MVQFGTVLFETAELTLQLPYREETKTDLLAGRLAVLAGSVYGPVRDSAFRDARIDTPTQKFQKSSFGILEIFYSVDY